MGDYVTAVEVQAFLSTSVVREALDDDNDGIFDSASMARFIADGEAIMNGTMRGIIALPLVAPIDPIVVTATLQTIHCLLTRRHPEVFRVNVKICEEAVEMRKQIRAGNIVLGHALLSSSWVPSVESHEPRQYDRIGDNDFEG